MPVSSRTSSEVICACSFRERRRLKSWRSCRRSPTGWSSGPRRQDASLQRWSAEARRRPELGRKGRIGQATVESLQADIKAANALIAKAAFSAEDVSAATALIAKAT